MPENDPNATTTSTAATTTFETKTNEEEEVRDPAHVLELNDKYRRENKSLRDRLKNSEESLESERRKSMSEQERAIDEAKDAVRKEVEAEYRTKLLAAAVHARASAVLADPEDAWRLIDFEDVDPEDSKAIDEALKQLLEAKPYLAASAKPENQNIDQGPQGSTTKLSDANDWLRGVTSHRR